MTAEEKVKRTHPEAICVRQGGTVVCHYVYNKPAGRDRRFLAGSYGDKRRAWAEAARKIDQAKATLA